MQPFNFIAYIACPGCGKADAWRADHLLNDHTMRGCSWGTWFCPDCGTGIRGKVAADGMVSWERVVDIHGPKGVYLLRLPPRERPLWVISRASQVRPDFDHHYWVEDTCTTNLLMDAEEVIVPDGEDFEGDPHGLFELVEVREVDTRQHRQAYEWVDLFRPSLRS
ncbi:MAG: hypothetical protein VKL39_24520 [Leptolyngbyaceae bacterium]|nr:hypothetical protein [Leptolyngbyaceae bacterium]